MSTGLEFTGGRRRTRYRKFFHKELTRVVKSGSDSFSPFIFEVVRAPSCSFFFVSLLSSIRIASRFRQSTAAPSMTGETRPWQSLIRSSLLSRTISADDRHTPAARGGGKVTVRSTCSVLLRRNYFLNSICSKFGAGADTPWNFPKESTLSTDCAK